MVRAIVTHANNYSRGYVNSDGPSTETTVEEIYKYIAFLIYFGIVTVGGDVANYWSTKSMYHCLWVRKTQSWVRYKALSAFLHVVDPGDESAVISCGRLTSFLHHFNLGASFCINRPTKCPLMSVWSDVSIGQALGNT